MSTKDIPEGMLVQVARYLDRFPPAREGQDEEDVEQYWVLLLNELRRLPNPLGSRFAYTRSQLAQFGTAIENDRSPSIDVLHDLQSKDLPLNVFEKCLEEIGCQRARNVFLAATPPEITHQPQTQALRDGDELQLSCEAFCRPGPPEYFWFRLRNKDTKWEPLVNSNTNKLIISDVNPDHSGLYTCRVMNPNINDLVQATTFSSQVEVTVEEKDIKQKTPIRQEVGDELHHPPAFPPIIQRQPSSVTVEYGQEAVLHCQASGEDLVYDWYKNGALHEDSVPSGELVIKNAKQEHAGEYHCNVINQQGGRVQSKGVKVTVVPKIVIDKQPPSKLRGEYGEEVRLECSAHSPIGRRLAYQWMKDKKDIPGAKNKVLKRKFVETRSHIYRLCCRVSLAEDSSVSVVSSTTKVIVEHMKITKQPKSIQGYIGEHVELVCEAKVIGPHNETMKIEYLWLKSDRLGGKKELLSGMQYRQEGGRLVFENLEVAHNGYYICQACLKDNFLVSDEVQVSVAMPGDSVVRIGREPVSWVVSVGGEFRMVCRAEASSKESLKYQWYFNYKEIPEAIFSVLEKKDIKESDYGPYYCKVCPANGHGVRTGSVYVTQPHYETMASSSPGNSLEQWEAEKYLWTIDEKRYAREKVALLIGNQHYDNLETLKETGEEILELSKKLEEANFKVFSFVNLKLMEMIDIFNWFCGLLSAGVYGLFYYSGHGFSHNHVVYLMPVDSPEGSADIQKCLASDHIANRMQKTQCRAIMMLDCCQVFGEGQPMSGINTPQTSLNMSNIVEVYSCPAGQRAYEQSSFHAYFIEALDKKLTLADFLSQMPEAMKRNPHGTRPWNRQSFMDSKIAFHDDIMRDDVKREEELDKIWDQWEEAHRLPPKTTLKLKSLHDLLSVELVFNTYFTNALSVFVYLRPMKPDVTSSLKLDEKSLADQGAAGELVQPALNSTKPYEIRVMNTQRIRSLTLHLCFSACLPGQEERLEEVAYKLPDLPLLAILSS